MGGGGEKAEKEKKEKKKGQSFPSCFNQYFYQELLRSNLYPKLQQGVKLNEQL